MSHPSPLSSSQRPLFFVLAFATVLLNAGATEPKPLRRPVDLENSSALELYLLSRQEIEAGNQHAAMLAFYAALLRYSHDERIFVMLPEESGDFRALYQAIQRRLSDFILRAIVKEPAALDHVIAEIRVWSPRVADDYHPGWRYVRRRDNKADRSADTPEKDALIRLLGRLRTTLADERYQQAVAMVRSRSKHPHGGPVSDLAQARKEIAEIEAQTDMAGLSVRLLGLDPPFDSAFANGTR